MKYFFTELCAVLNLRGCKNKEECDIIKLNKSRELREKIIKVNEYKKEEF
jgi:hypothetical protein